MTATTELTTNYEQCVDDFIRTFRVREMTIVVDGSHIVEINGLNMFPGESQVFQAIPGCYRNIVFDVRFKTHFENSRGRVGKSITLIITV